jgi:hypothetical protein
MTNEKLFELLKKETNMTDHRYPETYRRRDHGL